jgi:hypothetical protein
MRTRRTAALAAVAVTALLVMSGPATATRPAKDAAPPTRAACEAFSDYFQIEFLVAFATAFAQVGNEEDAAKAEDEIRDSFHLLLSPKLERITTTLAAGTEPPIRKLFAQQAKAYGKGVAMLEDVGLNADQIQALAEVELTAETDLQQVVGDVDLDKQELSRAAKKFGASAKSLDVNDASAKQKAAFSAAGSACGVFPVGGDCKALVTADEAAAFLGAAAETGTDDGTCTYTAEAASGQDDHELAVDVYESSLAFDRLTASSQSQSVPGVGDAAVAVDGFNAFTSAKTCGRTLFVNQGDRTVVVAGCVGDAPPSAEALAGIATNVLSRLPAGASS